MEVSARILDRVHILDLAGQPEAGSREQLRDRFAQSLERGRRQFVLNLTDAPMLDSMLIGELVACFKRARERGGDVKLVVIPGGIVHELLQLAGLDQVFQIFGDDAEAAASYRTT